MRNNTYTFILALAISMCVNSAFLMAQTTNSPRTVAVYVDENLTEIPILGTEFTIRIQDPGNLSQQTRQMVADINPYSIGAYPVGTQLTIALDRPGYLRLETSYTVNSSEPQILKLALQSSRKDTSGFRLEGFLNYSYKGQLCHAGEETILFYGNKEVKRVTAHKNGFYQVWFGQNELFGKIDSIHMNAAESETMFFHKDTVIAVEGRIKVVHFVLKPKIELTPVKLSIFDKVDKDSIGEARVRIYDGDVLILDSIMDSRDQADLLVDLLASTKALTLVISKPGFRDVRKVVGVGETVHEIPLQTVSVKVGGQVDIHERGPLELRIYQDDRLLFTIPIAANGTWAADIPREALESSNNLRITAEGPNTKGTLDLNPREVLKTNSFKTPKILTEKKPREWITSVQLGVYGGLDATRKSGTGQFEAMVSLRSLPGLFFGLGWHASALRYEHYRDISFDDIPGREVLLHQFPGSINLKYYFRPFPIHATSLFVAGALGFRISNSTQIPTLHFGEHLSMGIRIGIGTNWAIETTATFSHSTWNVERVLWCQGNQTLRWWDNHLSNNSAFLSVMLTRRISFLGKSTKNNSDL